MSECDNTNKFHMDMVDSDIYVYYRLTSFIFPLYLLLGFGKRLSDD